MNLSMFEGKGERAKWRTKLKIVPRNFQGRSRVAGWGDRIQSSRREYTSHLTITLSFLALGNQVQNQSTSPKGSHSSYGHGFPLLPSSSSSCIFHAIKLALGEERERQEREPGPQK